MSDAANSTAPRQRIRQRLVAIVRWLRGSTTGVACLSIMLGSVVGLVVSPLVFAAWFGLGLPRAIRHTQLALRWPAIAARLSTYSLSVSDWILAILMGWLLSRLLRRRLRVACVVCALAFVVVPEFWLWMDIGFGFWRFPNPGRMLLETLPPKFLIFVLMYSTAEYVRRCHRIPPGHCPGCGYNLTGNTSGICPECGTACRVDQIVAVP